MHRSIIGFEDIKTFKDTLTAVRKLTKRDTFIDRADFMNLILFKINWDGKMPIPGLFITKNFFSRKS